MTTWVLYTKIYTGQWKYNSFKYCSALNYYGGGQYFIESLRLRKLLKHKYTILVTDNGILVKMKYSFSCLGDFWEYIDKGKLVWRSSTHGRDPGEWRLWREMFLKTRLMSVKRQALKTRRPCSRWVCPLSLRMYWISSKKQLNVLKHPLQF